MKQINSLTHKEALKIAELALDIAQSESYHIAVCILDASSILLCHIKDIEAGPHCLEASYKKAFTSSSQNKDTREIYYGILENKIPSALLSLDNRLTSMIGGLNIFVKNEKVASIGIAGAHLENDHNIALKAIEKWKQSFNLN